MLPSLSSPAAVGVATASLPRRVVLAAARALSTTAAAAASIPPAPTSASPAPPSASSSSPALTKTDRDALARLTSLTRLPPSSPGFLPTFDPPQADETRRPRHRGYLPVPRNPFPRHEGDRKVTDAYLAQTAPESPRRPSPAAAAAAGAAAALPGSRAAWRRRMAETRRESLEVGLKTLWHRKERHEAGIRARRARHAAHVAEDLDFFNRPADALTTPTITAATLNTAVMVDPDRRARIDRARSRVRTTEESRREARRSSVADLYRHAVSFIVLESHLREEVERVFHPQYWQRTWGRGENIWEALGPPPGLPDPNFAAGDASDSTARITRGSKRLMTLSGEMTGGRIP